MGVTMISFDLLEKYGITEFVNECPFCKKGIHVNTLHFHTEEFDGTEYVNVMGKCPVCNEIFLAKYNYELFQTPISKLYMNPKITYYPTLIKKTEFSSYIINVSPKFVELFNQAEEIENLGMIDICGISYRRAFEFLIKDFTAFLEPEKKDEIFQDNKISNVISNRLPEKYGINEIKEIASRSWWLGNDYAHYTKKYENKDINDLKECIDITYKYIELYLKYNYQTESIKK